jgi:hypothetical protein
MMRKLLTAAALLAALALTTAAHADTPPTTYCGTTVVAHGLKNELHVFGVSCKTARTVATTFARTGRSPGQWRCRRGGTNGAVLVTCTRGAIDRFHPAATLTAYDARWGE